MLRYIFMDVNPYLINLEQIYKKAWEGVIDLIRTKYDNFVSIKSLENTIKENIDIIDKKDEWINEIGEEKYQALIKLLKNSFDKVIDEYAMNNPINSILSTFFDDAKKENVTVIFVTSNFLLASKIQKLYTFPKNVLFESIEANTHLEASSLVDYASKHGLTSDEFACITQVKDSLINMCENNIFCVTIGDKHDYSDFNTILCLDSIDDLIFSNITYNFYSKNDEKEEL